MAVIEWIRLDGMRSLGKRIMDGLKYMDWAYDTILSFAKCRLNVSDKKKKRKTRASSWNNRRLVLLSH